MNKQSATKKLLERIIGSIAIRMARLLIASLILQACIFLAPTSDAQSYSIELSIVNNSDYRDSQIYFIVTGQGGSCFVNLKTHQYTAASGTYTPKTMYSEYMMASLADIKSYSGDDTYTLPVPATGSSRCYMIYNSDPAFTEDTSLQFPIASGPTIGKSLTYIIDKFEFFAGDVGVTNVNNTSVDYFSIPYTLTANISSDPAQSRTVGLSTPAEAIFDAFSSIVPPAASEQYGNTSIFKQLMQTDASGNIIRVVSPKSAAYADFDTSINGPQMCTHFLTYYVNSQCWKPGRSFSFYSKNYPNDTNVYYGEVSEDGQTLHLYSDDQKTPYQVNSLPRPSNLWGNPNLVGFPQYWQNTGSAVPDGEDPDNIDWGFVIMGQPGADSGPAEYWGTDPVVIAITMSICRGVMHKDNGTTAWLDPSQYYKGDSGVSTSSLPIAYYGKILHDFGQEGMVYAWSLDDVYGQNSSMTPTDTSVTLTLYPMGEGTATLTMAVSPDESGTTIPSVGEHSYKNGKTVEISAQAAAGRHFTKWTASENVRIANPLAKSTTATLTGASGKVTANFAENTAEGTLTIAASPDTGGTTNPVAGPHTLNVGEPTDVSATPGPGLHFTGWTKSGDVKIENPNLQKTQATLTSANGGSLTANFANDTRNVTLTMAVSPDGSGATTPTAGQSSHPDGSIVPISAQPANPALHHFVRWKNSGNSKIADITGASTTVTLSGDDTITAVFEANAKTANLTIAVNPAEGGTANPGAGVHPVVVGNVFKIQAYPADGYYFAGWTMSPGGLINDVTSETTTGQISGDATFTANFLQVPVTFLAKGSVFELLKSDVSMADDFTSAPSITAVYNDPVKNKEEVRAKLANVTKPSKESSKASVLAEWTRNLAVYDKKNFKGKETQSIYSLLLHPIFGILSTSVSVRYKGLQENPMGVAKAVYISPPVLCSVSGPHSAAGDIFILEGKYFGSALPTVYLEYTTVKSNVTSYNYKKCNVLRKNADKTSALPFQNAKGKANTSCMKVLADDTSYDIGYSQIQVEYPSLKKGQTPTGFIKLVNGIGLDLFYISAP